MGGKNRERDININLIFNVYLPKSAGVRELGDQTLVENTRILYPFALEVD